MVRGTVEATAAERLARDLVGDGDPIIDELAGWIASSRRFRDFVTGHRDKVRKKLRSAIDDAARRDVRAELRVAHLLLADRRLDLGFETYGSGKAGPDFTVSMRGERAFNLEVTRLQRPPREATYGGPLLTKLRQLPPSVANAVLVAIDGDTAGALDVAGGVRQLRGRADAKDEAFFVARGFRDARAFYERFMRLGAVLVWSEGATGDARASVWINPSARIAVPDRAIRACANALRAA